MKPRIRNAFGHLIKRMKDLPSPPSSITRVTNVLENPKSSARDLSEAISLDQSLTTRILRIVNSSYYGFPRRIESLDHAVAVLGYRSIHEVILVTTLFEKTATQSKGPLNRERFWEHAVAVGAAAKLLAGKTGGGNLDTVFLAGLLHDIGKVFLDAFLHDEYNKVVQTAIKENILLHEAEERAFGANHTDFGHWLSDEWHLPPSLVAAVMYHHNPADAPEYYQLACQVHIGDAMARALELGFGGDDTMPRINREAWAAVGLTQRMFEDLMEELLKNYDNEGLPF